MDPIAVARSHISSWLDQGLHLLTAPKKALRDDEPLPPPEDAYEARVIGNLLANRHVTALAEPEQGKPVVVAKTFTNSPHEAPRTRTDPGTRALIAALEKAWPELTEVGARMLVAQHRFETGGGSACWNWNLGNMKATVDQPHVYLAGPWEVVSERAAVELARHGNGLARIASDDEIASKGWSCPKGSKVVVFDPPHEASRFAAYQSLADGVSAWVSYYRTRVVTRTPDILGSLNSGDAAAVAHDLKQAGYYTGAEADYAAGLASRKAEIDASMGWSP